MKRCPQCNRTYDDDALSFCLDDGSPLVSTIAPSSFDPSATVQYPQSRETSPPPMAQPQKRSAWPWILGIGAVLVFLGIGLVILVFAIASVTSDNSNNRNANNSNSRVANRNTNANTNKNTNTENTNENANTRSTLTTFTDEFSTETWGVGTSQYGKTSYQDEEYHMHATKGGYIVMY